MMQSSPLMQEGCLHPEEEMLELLPKLLLVLEDLGARTVLSIKERDKLPALKSCLDQFAELCID